MSKLSKELESFWILEEDFGTQQDTCTNWDIHALYSDRGIENQCPYCTATEFLGRTQSQ